MKEKLTIEEWLAMEWADPNGEFSVFDDGEPHGQIFLVLPGGQLVPVGSHDNPEVDRKRAQWLAWVLNDAKPANR